MQLATPRLILRELVDDDWRAILAIETPEVVRYMFQEVPTEASARAYVASSIAAAGEQPRRVYELAITARGHHTMIGRCGMGVEAASRTAMLWYSLHPDHHGRGYATEAARALIAYGFAELDLHRVYGDCDPRNPASARVMERLGMRREAHHVENAWVKGEWCDSLVYAVLAREWTAR